MTIDDDEEFKIDDDIKLKYVPKVLIYSSRKDSYKRHCEDLHNTTQKPSTNVKRSHSVMPNNVLADQVSRSIRMPETMSTKANMDEASNWDKKDVLGVNDIDEIEELESDEILKLTLNKYSTLFISLAK